MFQEEYAVAYFPKQQKTHLISSVVSSNAADWEKKSNILYVAIPIFLSFTAQRLGPKSYFLKLSLPNCMSGLIQSGPGVKFGA